MRNSPDDHDDHRPGAASGAAGHGASGRAVPDRPETPDGRLDVLAAEYQLLLRDMLDAALDQLAWGSAESVTGLTLREHLTLTGGLPAVIAARLEAVAHRIDAIPAVAAAYRTELLTFDQLADFVRLTRSCHGPRLALLDEQAGALARQLAEEDRLHDFTRETELLHEDTRAPGHRDRAERRALDGDRLIRQQDFDGGGFIMAELGPVGFAKANAAIDASADALQAHADATGAPRETSMQRLRADGLLLMADVFLAGCDGSDGATDDAGPTAMRRAARPTMTFLVDLADATADRFGAMLRTVGGQQMPVVSARLLEVLGANAELLVQLRDGRRPLAELRASDTPEAVRRAVLARDGGCRFGQCNAPMSAVHVHHINGRDSSGRHDPDELFAACEQHHLRHIHRYGWKPQLLPLTGEIIWRHPSGRRFSTLPRLRRPRPRVVDRLAPWRAPPIPSVPPDEPPHRPDPPSHWTDPPDDLAELHARAP